MEFKDSRDSLHRGVSQAYPAPPPPKRTRLILALFGTFVLFAILFSTPATEEVQYVAKTAAKEAVEHIPGGDMLPSLSRYNPFGQAVHEPPPPQRNSSSEDTEWYSDWKWLNPFSSSITMDDTRSVLPHLAPRAPIYTYYDTDIHKDPIVQQEESRLLLIWRRAWWAKGFRPIVLSKAEAMKNPYYETFMKRQTKMSKAVSSELMRWLAWGHMGSGILTNWLVLPMAARNDHDLKYLRHGQYPKDEQDNKRKIKRYEKFDNGIFWGHQEAIENAITATLNKTRLEDKEDFLDAVGDDRSLFALEPKPSGVAFYDDTVITEKYKPIAEKLTDARADALKMLSELINNHIHATFLATFPEGFDILSSRPHETTLLAAHGSILADALNKCPTSPLPQSCPPNNSDCRPCESIRVNYPTSLTNSTKTFTIGTIPHPYTLATLIRGKPEIDVRYVRRESRRDPWLEKATEATLTKGLSAYVRITHFKEQIVTDAGQTAGIWHSAERDWLWKDLEWRFGFTLENHNSSDVIRLPEVTREEYPKELSPLLSSLEKDAQPKRKEIHLQASLISEAKQILAGEKKKAKGKPDICKVVEAWHLADTEAWKFVRAFEARARMERAQWEKEESKFLDEEAKAKE